MPFILSTLSLEATARVITDRADRTEMRILNKVIKAGGVSWKVMECPSFYLGRYKANYRAAERRGYTYIAVPYWDSNRNMWFSYICEAEGNIQFPEEKQMQE